MIERYFDCAATTPLDPQVLKEMMPFLVDGFGNASSIHEMGRRSRAAVELARQRVADLIGAEDPSQIVFTSGATEANNWVASLFGDEAWLSPFEHSAMREPGLLGGWAVLPNDGLSITKPASARIVSVMSVNNEIGARWDVRELTDAQTHADVTQQVGKLPIDVQGLDFASFSAHKFYGPKGTGALFVANPPVAPFTVGGEQEHGMRGGTLNVAGIVGMGAAAALSIDRVESDVARAIDIRNLLLDQISRIPEVSVWGAQGSVEEWSPYILAVSFAGIEGESLVIEADQAGYAISSGAACSAGSTEPSHVLTALGVDARYLRGTIRISTGRFTSLASAEEFGKLLPKIAEKLRRMKL
jgi:cysteine desulfurase